MENNKSLVSVVMNCYNSDAYLKEAVESVINQTYGNWEIIFWDNQSTDNSALIIKSYDDTRIKYFYAPNHTILGEGRNLALEKVSGDYIAFLDCDDTWHYKKLELQLKEFKKNSNVGLCYTHYKMINTTKETFFTVINNNNPMGNVSKNIVINYNNWKIGMSTVMISKKVLMSFKKDLFDTKLKLVEEYEFFSRVLRKFEIAYCLEVLTEFKWHGNNNSLQYKKNWSDEYMYMATKFKRYNFQENEIKYLENTSVFYKIKTFLFDEMIFEAKQNNKYLQITSIKYLIIKLLLFFPIKIILKLKPFWYRGAYA